MGLASQGGCAQGCPALLKPWENGVPARLCVCVCLRSGVWWELLLRLPNFPWPTFSVSRNKGMAWDLHLPNHFHFAATKLRFTKFSWRGGGSCELFLSPHEAPTLARDNEDVVSGLTSPVPWPYAAGGWEGAEEALGAP